MWNVKACNLFYEKFLEDQKDLKYKQFMNCVKPCVETILSSSVLKNQTPSKKTRSRIDRKKEINKQNKRLLVSMMKIDTKPSYYHPSKLNRNRTFTSLNQLKFKKEQQRISLENRKLLNSIQSAQSDYAYNKIQADSKKYLQYKKNLVKPLFLKGCRPISSEG